MNSLKNKNLTCFQKTQYEEQLFLIAEMIASEDTISAQEQINNLLVKLNADDDSQNVTYLVFARALAQHFTNAEVDKANIYLKTYEIPQIQLFNVLATEVPLVTLVSDFVVELLAKACEGLPTVTLIDIGIGTGRQMIDLLRKLSQSEKTPPRLQIIGIEPSEQSLIVAKKNIFEAANELSLDVDFWAFSKCLEELSDEDWQHLYKQCKHPIINASFALHHICEINGQDIRTMMLRRLNQLDPLLIVLSEPNTDHVEPDFLTRFHNCWLHYSTILKMIDGLDIDQQSKNGLKSCFFGREVIDVLKADNSTRIERHEIATSWINRLTESGFKLYIPSIDSLSTSTILNIQKQAQLYIDFQYNEIPLVHCGVNKMTIK
jgi:hypothetical protein